MVCARAVAVAAVAVAAVATELPCSAQRGVGDVLGGRLADRSAGVLRAAVWVFEAVVAHNLYGPGLGIRDLLAAAGGVLQRLDAAVRAAKEVAPDLGEEPGEQLAGDGAFEDAERAETVEAVSASAAADHADDDDGAAAAAAAGTVADTDDSGGGDGVDSAAAAAADDNAAADDVTAVRRRAAKHAGAPPFFWSAPSRARRRYSPPLSPRMWQRGRRCALPTRSLGCCRPCWPPAPCSRCSSICRHQS